MSFHSFGIRSITGVGVAVAVALGGGALTTVGAAAAPSPSAPPYNQAGLSSAFGVGCFFTTDIHGNPLQVPEGGDWRPAELQNAQDREYLMTTVPDFFAWSMEAVNDTEYPFQVAVNAEIGVGEENKLPENPMPGETYSEYFASDLSLTLPESVAHVIRERAGYDGLVGTVVAHAALEGSADSGMFSVPLTSNDFPLGSVEQPIVPVDTVAPLELLTTGYWTNLTVPADWNTDHAELMFSGYDAVDVSVQLANQVQPGQTNYHLNLSCFPNGAGGIEATPVHVGTLYGNYQGTAPTVTSAGELSGTVGVPYTHRVTASGDQPITFALAEGELPEGLTLDADTGLIEGTPLREGEVTFTLTATNAAGEHSLAHTMVIEPEGAGNGGSGGDGRSRDRGNRCSPGGRRVVYAGRNAADQDRRRRIWRCEVGHHRWTDSLGWTSRRADRAYRGSCSASCSPQPRIGQRVRSHP